MLLWKFNYNKNARLEVKIMTFSDEDPKISNNKKAASMHEKALSFFDEWKAEFGRISQYSELKDFWWKLSKRSMLLSDLIREEIKLLED